MRVIIFIILHQETLQKNFIVLNRAKNDQETLSWFDEFVRACLRALNSDKEIICVIERSNRYRILYMRHVCFMQISRKIFLKYYWKSKPAVAML